MPVYTATIRMRDSELLNDQDFSSVWHVVTEGTSDDAWGLAQQIAQAMAGNILPPTITVYSVGIRNPDVINGLQTRAVSIPGTRVVTGDALPGWNVARMQMVTSVGSRPVTKWLRMGLTEDDVTGQTLASATQAALASFVDDLETLTGLCDKFGTPFTSFGTNEFVYMRQMGWHRRTRPGFKRGWVPVTP